MSILIVGAGPVGAAGVFLGHALECVDLVLAGMAADCRVAGADQGEGDKCG